MYYRFPGKPGDAVTCVRAGVIKKIVRGRTPGDKTRAGRLSAGVLENGLLIETAHLTDATAKSIQFYAGLTAAHIYEVGDKIGAGSVLGLLDAPAYRLIFSHWPDGKPASAAEYPVGTSLHPTPIIAPKDADQAIRFGMSSPGVRAWQIFLRAHLHVTEVQGARGILQPTRRFDNPTVAWTRAFQRMYGLDSTGRLDAKTYRKALEFGYNPSNQPVRSK